MASSFPPIRGLSFGGKVVVAASITNTPTLTTLTLSSTQFAVGPQGTVIGVVQGLTSGSTLLLTDSHSGAVQLVGGVIQIGPSSPTTAGSFNIQLTEVLSNAVNTPNISTIGISEVIAIPTIDTPASIPGTPHVGSPITAIDAVWNNGVTSTAYQWQVGGVNGTGSGATTLTYSPVIGDLSQTLTIIVTATNLGGSSLPSTSAASAAVQASISNSTPYVILLAA